VWVPGGVGVRVSGGVDPLNPTVETIAAALIALNVSILIRRGVSQPKW
jgi:hypothetical protein